jgi:hypothetical protein
MMAGKDFGLGDSQRQKKSKKIGKLYSLGCEIVMKHQELLMRSNNLIYPFGFTIRLGLRRGTFQSI